MPRAAGQIDLRKSEDILDAAAAVFAERGLDASMDEVARRAQVSKQTIYNHFGAKEDLLRKLFDRRRDAVVASLDPSHADEPLEDRLAEYAERIMAACAEPGYSNIMRSAIAAAATRPEAGALIYDAGPGRVRAQLADFVRREAGRGRLTVTDVQEAADHLYGMAIGALLPQALLRPPLRLDHQTLPARARACARAFLRAYGAGPVIPP